MLPVGMVYMKDWTGYQINLKMLSRTLDLYATFKCLKKKMKRTDRKANLIDLADNAYSTDTGTH